MSTLREFFAQMQQGQAVPRPPDEQWDHMIQRISQPQIAEIDEETYWYFLEVLPPKYQNGRLFAFAEGAEPLRLFWWKGDQHFCRQLTHTETASFCHLAHINIPW